MTITVLTSERVELFQNILTGQRETVEVTFFFSQHLKIILKNNTHLFQLLYFGISYQAELGL